MEKSDSNDQEKEIGKGLLILFLSNEYCNIYGTSETLCVIIGRRNVSLNLSITTTTNPIIKPDFSKMKNEHLSVSTV